MNDFKLFSNEKVAVLSRAKVGSRYTNTLFTPHTKKNSIMFDEFGRVHEESDEKPRLQWQLLTDTKTNKRDLFLLYRDPYQRFLSAVVEDVILDIPHFQYNQYAYLYFSLFNKWKINPLDMIEDLNEYQRSRKWVWKDNYENIIIELVSTFIQYLMMVNPMLEGHNALYLQIVYNIYNKFGDKDKIKLLNLDNLDTGTLKENIVPYLDSNGKAMDDKVSEEEHRLKNSNRNFKTTVNKVIEMNPLFVNFVNNLLLQERSYYNELDNIRYKKD